MFCPVLTLQYVRDQQGGAVVVTGQTAVGQVLLDLQGEKVSARKPNDVIHDGEGLIRMSRNGAVPSEAPLQLSGVWREEFNHEPEEQIAGV